MSISCILIPYSQRLWHLYVYNWIYGFGSGAWINAKNVWTIELWSHRSAPVLQLSGLMFGVGSILGPLIDDPYLTGHVIPSNGSVLLNMTQIEEDRMHNIRSPFLITASIQMIGIFKIKYKIDFNIKSDFRSHFVNNYVFSAKIRKF